MQKEFEVISHSQLDYINVFLVGIAERAVHLHQDLEIGLVTEGSVTVSTNHSRRLFTAGEAYLINPMEPHEFISAGGDAVILAIQLFPGFGRHFFPDAAAIRFASQPELGSVYAENSRRFLLLKSICLLLAESYLARGENYEFRCLSLASSLLQQLTENVPWSVMSVEDSLSAKQRAERIFSITDYIQRNFNRKLLLSEIALREKLTLSYLSHFFKDTMGVTFQEYLNRVRFDHACMLLEKTERSILDISVSSGFSDVRYFNRMFQLHHGCSPSAYRADRGSRSPRISPSSTTTQYFFPPEEALERLRPLRAKALAGLGGISAGDIFPENDEGKAVILP